MTHKYTTGEPNFIETGHLEPAPVDTEIIECVKQVVSHALDTLEIQNGASHSELKIDENGKIRLIEIGGRMGGDCIGSDLVRYSTGFDFVRMVIDVACGREPVFEKICEPCAVKSLFMFTQEDVAAFETLKKEHPEKILKIVSYFPENLGHVTDSSNRVGCYIVKA